MSCGCGDALAKLYLFIDQEIDDASCADIRSHIDSCQGCLAEYDLEQLVRSLVGRSCSEQAPEVLRTRVLASIRTVQIRIEGS